MILQKKLGWETFWDSVKFTWDSTFVDALDPRDAIEIKPKSNTGTDGRKDKLKAISPEPSTSSKLGALLKEVYLCKEREPIKSTIV